MYCVYELYIYTYIYIYVYNHTHSCIHTYIPNPAFFFPCHRELQATRKELRDLLSAFGELTSVRLPKKFDGKHRGFAFADFVTHQAIRVLVYAALSY